MGATHDPLLRRRMHGLTLVIARTTAVAFVAIAIALFVRGVPYWFDRTLGRARELFGSGPYEGLVVAVNTVGLISAAVWCALAVLILLRRSRDLLGILLALGFVSLGLILADPSAVMFLGSDDPIVAVVIWMIGFENAFALVWVFVFPDGRFVPRWGVALALGWAAWSILRIPIPEIGPGRLGTAGALAYFAFPAASVACQIYRFVRSDEVRRQQLKWFLYGGTLVVAAWSATVVIPLLLRPEPGPSTFLYRTVARGVLTVSSVLLPTVVTIAIFRLGLLDIDLIINRTVAYGALTSALVAVFVIGGGVAQRAFLDVTGAQSDLVLLAVAVPVALAFVPLRTRVQALADRFVADRTVLTVLFVDIASSTERATALGDRAWRDLLERFRAAVRRELRRFGGHEVDTAGDGFFVTFEGPGRAIRCSSAIVEAVRPLGISVRCGLHIGECEVRGGKVSGISVHVGARVASAAGAGEVLVSRTLRDLVAGSDIRLNDRGSHTLKGVPGDWQLYAVAHA